MFMYFIPLFIAVFGLKLPVFNLSTLVYTDKRTFSERIKFIVGWSWKQAGVCSALTVKTTFHSLIITDKLYSINCPQIWEDQLYHYEVNIDEAEERENSTGYD